MWFGTEEGVTRYDGLTWTTYTHEDGLSSNNVRAIAVGPDGTVWCGTHGVGGVSWLEAWPWVTRSAPAVQSIAVDAEGGLWFGTRQGLWHCAPLH